MISLVKNVIIIAANY